MYVCMYVCIYVYACVRETESHHYHDFCRPCFSSGPRYARITECPSLDLRDEMSAKWAKAALPVLLLTHVGTILSQDSDGLPLDLPDGFEVSVYASIPGARALAGAWVKQGEYGPFGGGHVTYVGTGSRTGKIWESFQEQKVSPKLVYCSVENGLAVLFKRGHGCGAGSRNY